MLRSLSSRLILTVLAGSFSLPCIALAQTQDSQSVAEAAKKAREQKKASAKQAKVVTEDDIPARVGSTDAAAPAGQAASTQAGGSQAAAPTGDSATTSAVKAKGSSAREAAEVASLKAAIAKAEKDLDFSKRALALNQDTFYSNPDYAHDTAGKAKLDDAKQQIADKQDELDKLKAKLAEHPQVTPAAGDTSEAPAAPATPQS